MASNPLAFDIDLRALYETPETRYSPGLLTAS